MKQRITPNQLNELTEEQKKRLREWWEPKEGDHVIGINKENLWVTGEQHTIGSLIMESDSLNDGGCGCCSMNHDLKDFLPLLTIGQMIEILMDKLPKTDEYQILLWRNPKPGNYNPRYFGWNFETFIDKERKDHRMKTEPELCDVLFEAVKEVL